MKRSLVLIIALGILSRSVHSGWILFDKYLGDALYAAMVYVLVRLFRPTGAVIAMAIMTALELFQLTMIPAHLFTSPYWFVRIAARLMGTEFSFLDLAAYAVGIAVAAIAMTAWLSSHARQASARTDL